MSQVLLPQYSNGKLFMNKMAGYTDHQGTVTESVCLYYNKVKEWANCDNGFWESKFLQCATVPGYTTGTVLFFKSKVSFSYVRTAVKGDINSTKVHTFPNHLDYHYNMPYLTSANSNKYYY